MFFPTKKKILLPTFSIPSFAFLQFSGLGEGAKRGTTTCIMGISEGTPTHASQMSSWGFLVKAPPLEQGNPYMH